MRRVRLIRGITERLAEKFERDEPLATPPVTLEPRYRPFYTKSSYLLHVGWPFGAKSACDRLEFALGETIPCCSLVSIAIYYPYIEAYSLAYYPDLRELPDFTGYAVYGWGRPYEFYMRFEFDTGEDADSYKIGAWYYYRVAPGEGLEEAWRDVYTESLLAYVEGVRDCDVRSQDLPDAEDIGGPLAVSHEARRSAVLLPVVDLDTYTVTYHVYSGEGKVLYYFMPRWKYEKMKREAEQRKKQGDVDDVDDWRGWRPGGEYTPDLGPAWWRIVLLGRKQNQAVHATLRGAILDWSARVAWMVPDPWIREAVLRSAREAERELGP